MTFQSAEEAKKTNIAKMGEPLGEMYSALWQAVANVHFHWHEYVELFGSKPERITLINRAAPAFFRMLQDELWEMSLLHLARLTDPAKSMDKQDKTNLTIQALPALIQDTKTKAQVIQLIDVAVKETTFCRDWRNRRIAHYDLKLALERPTTPLAEGSRADVTRALKALAAVLNGVASHYIQSQTVFDFGGPLGGAVSLLHLLDSGLAAEELRQKRLSDGRPTEEDLIFKDI